MRSHYALTALHVINTDLLFLDKAIRSGDPQKEILLRIEDMRRIAGDAIARRAERSDSEEGR